MKIAYFFIIIIALLELALIFGAFGCGGAAFTILGPDPTGEAGPPEANPIEEITQEATAPDAFKAPKPEAGAPDVFHEADASPIEASPIEAEAGQPPPDVCSPIPASAFSCGTDRIAVLAPGDFCVDEAAQTTAPGHSTPTPNACRCDYNCRCILAANPNPCAIYGQTVARCIDNGAPGMKPGSVVVCQ
jgi:hypothetical protein